jgi:hypothetical protein
MLAVLTAQLCTFTSGSFDSSDLRRNERDPNTSSIPFVNLNRDDVGAVTLAVQKAHRGHGEVTYVVDYSNVHRTG